MNKDRSSNKMLLDGIDKSSAEGDPQAKVPSSCDEEDLVSLPRSKSLSNNKSGSSYCV